MRDGAAPSLSTSASSAHAGSPTTSTLSCPYSGTPTSSPERPPDSISRSRHWSWVRPCPGRAGFTGSRTGCAALP